MNVVARNSLDADLQHLDVRLLCCRMTRLHRWASGNFSAPYWRLYHNKRPGASITSSGNRIDLVPKRIYLIPPDTPYSGALQAPVDHFYIHFLTTPTYHATKKMIHVVPASRDLLDAIGEIEQILLEGRQQTMHLAVLARYLVVAALRHVPDECFEQTYADSRISGTIQHMQRHLAERVSNRHLADIAHMNANAYIRLFRNATGSTPQAFLTRLRIQQACVLLHYTERTIDDIAEATGFCDRYHLSHSFKKLRDMGPATFRRMMENTRI
jgi:AraC-like DNA-binding protein